MRQRSCLFCIMIFLPVLALLCLSACAQKSTELSEQEARALALISGLPPEEFCDISAQALDKERTAKFPAVSKVSVTEGGLYGFICQPIGYNAPVTLALVIDGASGLSLGMQILHHSETEHYVRDMESEWFTERFAGKDAEEYLRPVFLEARGKSDIVCITGATVTTQGVINGVNAAFGMFQEYVRRIPAPDVPYMVSLEPGNEGLAPVSYALSISADGVQLGEVTLEDIKTLPSVKRMVGIHSTAGDSRHSFRGTLLSNVLDFLDPDIKERYRLLNAVGADGYTSTLTMEEVLKENSVYLMYEDNGEPLLWDNGEPGAMRIVVLGDAFGQRFTNFLLEITLINEGQK